MRFTLNYVALHKDNLHMGEWMFVKFKCGCVSLSQSNCCDSCDRTGDCPRAPRCNERCTTWNKPLRFNLSRVPTLQTTSKLLRSCTLRIQWSISLTLITHLQTLRDAPPHVIWYTVYSARFEQRTQKTKFTCNAMEEIDREERGKLQEDVNDGKEVGYFLGAGGPPIQDQSFLDFGLEKETTHKYGRYKVVQEIMRGSGVQGYRFQVRSSRTTPSGPQIILGCAANSRGSSAETLSTIPKFLESMCNTKRGQIFRRICIPLLG